MSTRNGALRQTKAVTAKMCITATANASTAPPPKTPEKTASRKRDRSTERHCASLDATSPNGISALELGIASDTDSAVRQSKTVKVSLDAVVSTATTTVPFSSNRSEPNSDHTPKKKTVQVGIRSFFASTGTAKAVVDAFRESERTLSVRVRWEEVDNGELMIGRFGQVPTEAVARFRKVAAFDVDGTVISVNGTHRFPKNATDWKFWNRCVPERIRQLYHEQGYTILLITNQSGFSTNAKRKKMFVEKMDMVLPQINVPLHVLVSTGKNKYRKPMMGMWDHFVSRISGPQDTIDMNGSFFVGDAAGRVAGWRMGAKKDFSASDRKWAINVGLPFHTPEEYFLGVPPTKDFVLDETGFDPTLLSPQRPLFTPTNRPLIPEPIQPEIVLFVGSPGSGKSAFAERWLVPKGYVHVNQDTLKTREKCIAACKAAVMQGKPVVVDNTNPDPSTRKLYIDLSKSLSCPIRCFHFQATLALAKHNDLFRAFGLPSLLPSSSLTTPPRSPLPDLAFGTFWKRYVEPCAEEGFAEIKKLRFSLDFGHILPPPRVGHDEDNDGEGGGVGGGSDDSERLALLEELTRRWRRWYA